MTRIHHFTVRFPQRHIFCDVFTGRGLLAKIPHMLSEKSLAENYLLLTDTKVDRLYGYALLRAILAMGLKCLRVAVPRGEKSKNRKIKEKIEDFMLRNRLGRDSAILALGGGVVGDLGGFVASTYMRGIPYIQIPTTFLSMVDSSIGGKTAVNHTLGKNMIGAFHQPSAVVMDVHTLCTLPYREYTCGMAEAIKYGAALDRPLFSMLEANTGSLKDMDPKLISMVVDKCAKLKSSVVQRDERERGPRKILNFGHTIAHALEIISSYKIRHGEAVAIGMAVESEISKRLGFLDEDSHKRLLDLLSAFSLPVKIPPRFSAEEIVSMSQSDKKVRKGKVEYALIKMIGSPVDRKKIAVQVDERVALEAIDSCIAL